MHAGAQVAIEWRARPERQSGQVEIVRSERERRRPRPGKADRRRRVEREALGRGRHGRLMVRRGCRRQHDSSSLKTVYLQ